MCASSTCCSLSISSFPAVNRPTVQCNPTENARAQVLTWKAATSGGRSAVTSREEGSAAARWPFVAASTAEWLAAVAPGSDQESKRRSSASTSWLRTRSSFINSSNLTDQPDIHNNICDHETNLATVLQPSGYAHRWSMTCMWLWSFCGWTRIGWLQPWSCWVIGACFYVARYPKYYYYYYFYTTPLFTDNREPR